MIYTDLSTLIFFIQHPVVIKMADVDHKGKDISGVKDSGVKQENRENNSTNGGKGSGDDADSLEEQPLDIGEHYLVRRSDDSWREYLA